MAAVAVSMLRPARRMPVPARIIAGDMVITEEGVTGTVINTTRTLCLVSVDDRHAIWIDRDQLMQAPGSFAPVAADGADPTAHPPPSRTVSQDFLMRLGAVVWKRRKLIILGWMALVIAALPLAATAEKHFISGGFLVEGSDPVVVLDQMRDDFKTPVTQQAMLVPGPLSGVEDQLFAIAGQLPDVAYVQTVSEPVESGDGSLVALTIGFSEIDDTAIDSYEQILDVFVANGFDRTQVQVAGTTAFYADTNAQTKKDLQKAEVIGIPTAFVVLLFVFGTLFSAILPLIIGLVSVVLSLAILHLFSLQMDLSVFVMNIALMMSLGLGIDYSLLGVSRFREELAKGASVRDAMIVTVSTSGRAAAISGIVVLAGISSLAVIPLPVMMSIALGGVIVVGLTVFSALTLLPALLSVLGPRIEKGRIAPARTHASWQMSRWYHLAKSVMRRPAVAALASLAILIWLASPVFGIKADVPHQEVLPPNSPSILASRTMQESFNELVAAPVPIILETSDVQILQEAYAQLVEIEHVTAVVSTPSPDGADRTLVVVKGDEATAMGGEKARDMTEQIRALDLGADFKLSGAGAGELEYLHVLREGAPKTVILIVFSTFLILTIAFRSVIIPAKAIILAGLSVVASLGMIVAVFQNGVGIELLGTQQLGYTEATIPIIIFALLFGLTMDYEVFMLAKITELWQSGLSSREATARGVATTAPLITGAAMILIVIGASFTFTGNVLVKQIGFGLTVSLILDATLVRFLLLPAAMRMLGNTNWWAPSSLLRRLPVMNWSHDDPDDDREITGGERVPT